MTTQPLSTKAPVSSPIPLVPPLLLALVLGSPAVFRDNLSPVGLLVTALGAIVAMSGLSIAARGRSLSRAAAAFYALATALIVWALVRSAAAIVPRVSLWGTIGQHNGAALWLAGLGFAFVVTLLASRRSLRLTLAVITGAGAIYAAAALLELVGGSATARWGSVAGLLENSSSLGQFLAVSALAGCSLALASRTVAGKVAAWAGVAASVGGIALGSSRTGLLGLLAGLAIAFVATRIKAGSRARTGIAFAGALTGPAVSALLVASALGRLGPAASRAVAALGTDRDAIWRSAWAALRQSPWLGRGLEQFSAWVTWSFTDGSLKYNATYDPHNWVLAVLIGLGAVGLALAVLTLASGLRALLEVQASSPGSWPIALAVGAVSSVGASGLVTWFSPAAVVAGAALFGALLATGSGPLAADAATSATRYRLAASVALAASAALLVAGLPGVPAERSLAAARSSDAASFARLYERWPDPSFAALGLYRALDDAPSSPTALAGAPSGARRYHVDLALSTMLSEQTRLADEGSSGAWDEFARAVADGLRADPASGIWDFTAALVAEQQGRDEAVGYARRALAFRLGSGERATMQRIAEGADAP